jgi:hypothetical protein
VGYYIYIERKPTNFSLMNFKALTLAALTAAAAIVPTAAEAKNVDQGHMNLAQAAARTGVQIKINPAACFKGDTYGWYWAAKNELVICQERRARANVETYWTAEDLDTLRHEVQHLVQDCRDGRRNGDLDAVYTEPVALAHKVLGRDGVQNVLETYSDASDHIKVMELEAFAVAAMNDPAEQVRDIQTYCF